MSAGSIITPEDLAEGALAELIAILGEKETAPNSSPLIDQMLGMVRLPPGNQWCAATAFAVYEWAARKLFTVNPCPRTGSSQRMWALADAQFKTQVARRGAIYVLRHSPTTGHVGLVENTADDGTVASEISGNTFADKGGRAGNCIARHSGPPEKTHGGELLGYIDFTRQAQAVA